MPKHAQVGPEFPPETALALANVPATVDQSIAQELPTTEILAVTYAARTLLTARIEYTNFATDFADKKGELVRAHALDRAILEKEMNQFALAFLTRSLRYSQPYTVPGQAGEADREFPSREMQLKTTIDAIEADHGRHGLTRQELQVDLPPQLRSAKTAHDQAVHKKELADNDPSNDVLKATSPEELEEFAARVQSQRSHFDNTATNIRNYGELAKRSTDLLLADMSFVDKAHEHAAAADAIDQLLKTDAEEIAVLFNAWQASIEALDQCTIDNWYRQRMAQLLGYALPADQGLPTLPTFEEWLPGYRASLDGEDIAQEQTPVFPADVSATELVLVGPDNLDEDE